MKITIRNLQKKIPVNPRRIKKALLKVLSLEPIKKSGEITVCFTTDSMIRKLNSKYLGKDNPTDVLAFDLGNSVDIIISADTALRNARSFGSSVQDELSRYAIHGLLHILGYGDNNGKKRKIMERRTEGILRKVK